jgi:hypothetical protein
VGERGDLGLTAVAGTREQAEALYAQAINALDAEAERRMGRAPALSTSPSARR